MIRVSKPAAEHDGSGTPMEREAMAKTKTGRKTVKRGKTATRKTAARAVATRKNERVPAFAYDERIPVIAGELRTLKRSATVAELFETLESAQFRTPRRVAATFRADQHSDTPVFAHGEAAGTWTLAKHTRTVNGSKRGRGRVSRKSTRRSK
jgi:hypothetical protein